MLPYSFYNTFVIGAHMHEVFKEMDGPWYISMNGQQGRENPMTPEVFMRTMLDMGSSADTIMHCVNVATQEELRELHYRASRVQS